MGLQNASLGALFVTPTDSVYLEIVDEECLHCEAKAFNYMKNAEL